MQNDIKTHLASLSDVKYAEFSRRLTPTSYEIMGIRVPILRNYAKQIVAGDWRKYLESAENDFSANTTFEEIMLESIVIGLIKIDDHTRWSIIERFIPKIDNWAVCDTLCAELKFIKHDKADSMNRLEQYLSSPKEFEVRFAIVTMIDHLILDDYIDLILKDMEKVKHEGYYVKMAIAWALSVCYIKFPTKTLNMLHHSQLDKFTHNRTIQKICESLRVASEDKTTLRKMKKH